MSYGAVLADLARLPHYREYVCSQCKQQQKVYILVIQHHCATCGRYTKLRRYAALGAEVEDVVDAVLEWLGQGADWDHAIRHKQMIDLWEDSGVD